MQVANLEATVLQAAQEAYKRGPGYAQESIVLREVEKLVQPRTLEEEQAILSAWNRLFQSGKLAWGYNLDNPSRPWFHVPNGSKP